MAVDIPESGCYGVIDFIGLGILDIEFFRHVIIREVGEFTRILVGGMVDCYSHIVSRATLKVDAVAIVVEGVVV